MARLASNGQPLVVMKVCIATIMSVKPQAAHHALHMLDEDRVATEDVGGRLMCLFLFHDGQTSCHSEAIAVFYLITALACDPVCHCSFSVLLYGEVPPTSR